VCSDNAQRTSDSKIRQVIAVKQIGFEGLSEDVDGDSWVVKLPRECVP